MPQYKDFLGLGIAGNFALHLDQAGEAEDFKDIITADEAAPKGMFPFYLPNYSALQTATTRTPKEILTHYPLSHERIKLPESDVNVQAEPEVGLLCKLTYKDSKIVSITPTHFGAYNDCSIRVAGAEKISDKKNWGADSKGIAAELISIDKFLEGGIMDSYSICSFLKRDGLLHAYGEDVALNGYSYFYTKLLDWIQNQINTQENFGPLEPLSEYIQACNYPSDAIISIGATRYTKYGEETFLAKGDRLYVVLYNHTLYSVDDVMAQLKSEPQASSQNMSILAQKVI
jgi:hypothetical protein